MDTTVPAREGEERKRKQRETQGTEGGHPGGWVYSLGSGGRAAWGLGSLGRGGSLGVSQFSEGLQRTPLLLRCWTSVSLHPVLPLAPLPPGSTSPLILANHP